LGIGEAVVSAIAFEPWIARIFTIFDPAEEGLISEINPLDNFL